MACAVLAVASVCAPISQTLRGPQQMLGQSHPGQEGGQESRMCTAKAKGRFADAQPWHWDLLPSAQGRRRCRENCRQPPPGIIL